MNFVRFVKTPRIGPAVAKKSNGKNNAKKPSDNTQLSMILTITTDFSPFAGSVQLLCELQSYDSILAQKRIHWTDTLRDIYVDIPIPSGLKEGRVAIRPVDSTSDTFLSHFLGGKGINHVVGVETGLFHVNVSSRHDTVYRHFKLPLGPLRIAEQAGETIIRHVWDAGIILSAAISYYPTSLIPDELQQLLSLIFSDRETRILELGTGVGILGITIAARYPQTKVVMTDLSDAQSLVDTNLHLNTATYHYLKDNASFRPLDWEERPFPEWSTTEKFDLIVMADVTYNTATFIALADTLEHLLRTGSKSGKVLCCGKRRHDEEEGFWRIIQERGFEMHGRVIFAIDLEGNTRYCGDGMTKQGEQLIDFIMMNLR